MIIFGSVFPYPHVSRVTGHLVFTCTEQLYTSSWWSVSLSVRLSGRSVKSIKWLLKPTYLSTYAIVVTVSTVVTVVTVVTAATVVTVVTVVTEKRVLYIFFFVLSFRL